ncbi:hypothetical protein F3J20_22650 [Paraburkholderia sp. Cy-641]|uniref:hypothetical protein n=1 Tax=Paraburkholderia sp. Cy-641 TaxID=2608337 RepID=UPI001421EE18|nr:hypothetical protein [Paraburkholderia sp. Cy-641]NIF80158.1 hypothetical protein [Paraburkholderia sp. Cy-641]
MQLIDLHAECRRAWLRQEQQPVVKQQIPQSNFEQSPYWRVGLIVAAIVVGIQVFSPNPDAPTESHRDSSVQTGHVRPMV